MQVVSRLPGDTTALDRIKALRGQFDRLGVRGDEKACVPQLRDGQRDRGIRAEAVIEGATVIRAPGRRWVS